MSLEQIKATWKSNSFITTILAIVTVTISPLMLVYKIFCISYRTWRNYLAWRLRNIRRYKRAKRERKRLKRQKYKFWRNYKAWRLRNIRQYKRKKIKQKEKRKAWIRYQFRHFFAIGHYILYLRSRLFTLLKKIFKAPLFILRSRKTTFTLFGKIFKTPDFIIRSRKKSLKFFEYIIAIPKFFINKRTETKEIFTDLWKRIKNLFVIFKYLKEFRKGILTISKQLLKKPRKLILVSTLAFVAYKLFTIF